MVFSLRPARHACRVMDHMLIESLCKDLAIRKVKNLSQTHFDIVLSAQLARKLERLGRRLGMLCFI